MKFTGTYNGKPIELELTEEQMEALGLKRNKTGKKTGWERVEEGESYWACDGDGKSINVVGEENLHYDDDLFSHANYFSDKALAENIIKAQLLQRKLWRRSAELCEKVDWRNPETKKYYIIYDYEDDELCIDFLRAFGRGLEEIYFDTKEHAEQVIEEFKDELIWYFTEFKSRMD